MTIPNPQSVYQATGGATSTAPFITVLQGRDPTPQDMQGTGGQFPSGQRWINTATNREWYLNGFLSAGGTMTANWQPTGTINAVQYVTGTAGPAISPDASGNLNLIGTNVAVVGDLPTHTLTLTAAGGAAITFLTDSGDSATPIAGVVQVTGAGGNLVTSAPPPGVGDGTIVIGINPPVTVDNGGTGLTSIPTGYVVCGGTAFTLNAIDPSTLNFVLTSNGPGATPAFKALPPTGITKVISQIFTAPGAHLYTPTVGMAYCDVEVVGGGGGGGGVALQNATFGAAGAGGGAGGYSEKSFSAATIGVGQALTVGTAGAASAAGNFPGGTGGTTSFGGPILIQATGGIGGAGSPGGPAAAPYSFSVGGAGGVGSLGDSNTVGNAGFDGTSIFDNFYALSFAQGGMGSSVYFGGSAAQVSSYSINASITGNAATSYGAGGGGAIATRFGAANAGGAGAAGIVIITEYCA